MAQLQTLDYSLIGKTSEEAVARGLASVAWYHSPIPRDHFRALLARRNGPAVRVPLKMYPVKVADGKVLVRLRD